MQRLFSFGFLALPVGFITLSLLGALLALRWRRLGILLALISSLCLFIAAIPAVSSYLLCRVERALPVDPDMSGAQAIVVLGGDARAGNGADITDALGPLSVERVLYAARAYRRVHGPVAVSGGPVGSPQSSQATLMKALLETDFGVPVTWTEGKSHTTWENAVYTARMLLPAGVKTVVLVSQPWHLPRAIWAFERVGFVALPWPTPRTVPETEQVADFLPSIGGLRNTSNALHEIIGGMYYRLQH